VAREKTPAYLFQCGSKYPAHKYCDHDFCWGHIVSKVGLFPAAGGQSAPSAVNSVVRGASDRR
jgi:hypothetical protein